MNSTLNNVKNVKLALEHIKKGSFVVLYDGDNREGEADLIFHAKFVTPEKIYRLRKDAGGLICLAVDKETAGKINLPFFVDLLNNKKFSISKITYDRTAYGDKPAFSIPINHKDVYTGITDNDRSLTIKSFAEIIENNDGIQKEFMNSFYAPGHVFLLIGSGLENRKGHTELSLELAKRAKLTKTMVLCEMLGKGKALSKEKARAYAIKNKFIFLEGKDLL